MGFLSSIFRSDRRNVRDLLLADSLQLMHEQEREMVVEEIVSVLNRVEHLSGVAQCSEICDTIMLRRINQQSKIEKHLLRSKPKPFVFLINRN